MQVYFFYLVTRLEMKYRLESHAALHNRVFNFRQHTVRAILVGALEDVKVVYLLVVSQLLDQASPHGVSVNFVTTWKHFEVLQIQQRLVFCFRLVSSKCLGRFVQVHNWDRSRLYVVFRPETRLLADGTHIAETSTAFVLISDICVQRHIAYFDGLFLLCDRNAEALGELFPAQLANRLAESFQWG